MRTASLLSSIGWPVVVVLLGFIAALLLVDIAQGQTPLALAPNFPDDVNFPHVRYRLFSDLDLDQQSAARQLGYFEISWNVPGTARIEERSYSSLGGVQQNHLGDLGFEEDNWDCAVNHYNDYDWAELALEQVQVHLVALGWNASSWDGVNGGAPAPAPASDDKEWAELSPEERAGAEGLCYFNQTWDQLPLDESWALQPTPSPTQSPTAAPAVSSPAPTTGAPIDPPPPTTDSPAIAAAPVEIPTDAPVGPPTAAPVTAIPTDAPVGSPPTAAPVTAIPTDAPVDAAPVITPPDSATTAIPTTESRITTTTDPTTASPTDSPDLFAPVALSTRAPTAVPSQPIRGALLPAAATTNATTANDVNATMNGTAATTPSPIPSAGPSVQPSDVPSLVPTSLPPPSTAVPTTTAPSSAAPSTSVPTASVAGGRRDDLTYPEFRYVVWQTLTAAQQVASATLLDYTEETWNVPGTALIEEFAFGTIEESSSSSASSSGTTAQIDAVQNLGFTQEVWDCYVNHYAGYDWEELTTVGVQKHYIALGWNADAWSGQMDPPETDDLDWDELTSEQRAAAEAVCFFRDIWDGRGIAEFSSAPSAAVDLSSLASSRRNSPRMMAIGIVVLGAVIFL